MFQFSYLMAGGAQGGGGTINLVMIGGMFLILWLFMIRPQAKKAKIQKQFINDMQPGDKVVTIAGIHGKINKLNDDNTIQLEVNPGSYMKIERSAISLEWSQQLSKPATTAVEKK